MHTVKMLRSGMLAVLLWLAAALLPILLFSNYHLFQLTMVVVYAIAILGLDRAHRIQRPDIPRSRCVLCDRRLCHCGADVLSTTGRIGRHCRRRRSFARRFGFLIGLPALRLGGLYLALTTFALAVAVPQLLKHNALEQWTGGVQGLVIDKPDPPFGLTSHPTHGCICSRCSSVGCCFCLRGTWCADVSAER